MKSEAIFDSSQKLAPPLAIAVAYSILVFVLFGLRAKKHAFGPILAYLPIFLLLTKA